MYKLTKSVKSFASADTIEENAALINYKFDNFGKNGRLGVANRWMRPYISKKSVFANLRNNFHAVRISKHVCKKLKKTYYIIKVCLTINVIISYNF